MDYGQVVRVKKVVDAHKAYEHTKYWVEQIGNRLDGTVGQKKAVEYAKRFWEKEGIECQILEFDGFVSIPGKGKVISGSGELLHCSVYAQSTSTDINGLEGNLEYVGTAQTMSNTRNLKGKIALSDRSGEITITQQALNCHKRGAIGIICANWGTGEQNYIHCCTVKDQWGNPSPEDRNQVPIPIPVLSVGYKDGLRLREEAEVGMKVRILSEVENGWKKIYLPFAKIMGNGPDQDQFILLGGGASTSALIPWNTCGIFMSEVLGVSVPAYAPYAFFNWIMPFGYMVYLLKSKKIRS